VRGRYRAQDAEAAAAWAWTAPGGAVYVIVDVQSTQEGLVQGRLDLWAVAGGGPEGVGRSAVMVSAASFGAFTFEDLTGDGLPDFLGHVADSAETAYPVFLPGAAGMMVEEIEDKAQGWRFSAELGSAPEVVRGAALACALRLWAEEPAPDGQPVGWRYLEIRRGGQLGAPTVAPPGCASGVSEAR